MADQRPRGEATIQREPFSPDELREYQRRLRSEVESLREDVERAEADILRPSGAERATPDYESIEESVLDAELDALAREDALGYEIREALERIRDGTFGLCSSCGERISRERLRLLPYARECKKCARLGEASPPV